MTSRRHALILAIALAAHVLPAGAQTRIEGQSYPATVTVGGSQLVLNGVGLRAVAWLKGYAAGLYLTARAGTPAQVLATPGAKRIDLRMLQNAPAAEFVKAVDVGFGRNTPVEQHPVLDERRQRFDALVQAVGSVHKGDVVLLDFVPGRGTLFVYNGQQRGEAIPGEDFYAALLGIFLGDKPVDKNLKAGLLGSPAS